MEIRNTPNAAGSPDDRDPSAFAADEQPQPRATPRPRNEQLQRFAPPSQETPSDVPPDSDAVVISDDGAQMSVTASGSGTVYAVQRGSMFIHRSSELPAPPQSASGRGSGTALVLRVIDSMQDVSSLGSAIRLVSRAPEHDRPTLLARTARRLATLLSEPDSWTDENKMDAFSDLIEGTADALERSP